MSATNTRSGSGGGGGRRGPLPSSSPRQHDTSALALWEKAKTEGKPLADRGAYTAALKVSITPPLLLLLLPSRVMTP